jgi:uncharacterized protein
VRVWFVALLCGAAFGAPQRPIIKELHVPITMRDGVRLYANIYLPSDHTRLPAILVRTPYNKGADITPNYQAFVEHGYVLVVEDVRGRYESEGVFQPLHQESADGDDTLNWIARRPWSNGNIGMMGGSYTGIVQWKAALLNNPHLKAIFPVVSGYDEYRDRFYSTGGAVKLANRLEWMAENLKAPGFIPDFSKFILHLPIGTSDIAATGAVSNMYREAMEHPTFDTFWRGISTREQLSQIRVPVFAVGGWYDNFSQSDLEAYAALHKSSGLNRILIGPWPHNMSVKFADADFGPDSQVAVRGLQLAWFDQWLMGKDSPLLSDPPVRIFLMGANRWLDDREWPPTHSRERKLYLTADGGLAAKPPAHAAPDRYIYDPHDPVPTRGGAVCCNPKIFPWGPMDQRVVEQRPDVLVYTTPAVKQDTTIAGPVKAVLWISTTSLDTDFTAKLVDVFPDGYARNLTDGILRLRYRNALDRPELAAPGQLYQVTIDAGVTGNVFLKGHRIRVEISSSNFPRFDRNPNTGGPIATETKLVPATQTIYHDADHPSWLSLMELPEAK